MDVSRGSVWALTGIKAGCKGTLTSLEAEKQDVDWGAVSESYRGGGLWTNICLSDHAISTCLRESGAASSTRWPLRSQSGFFKLLHCLASLILISSQLFNSVSFWDGEAADTTLISLDVSNVQINLLLENNKFFFHLNFQVVTSSLNFGFHLNHLFLLISQ